MPEGNIGVMALPAPIQELCSRVRAGEGRDYPCYRAWRTRFEGAAEVGGISALRRWTYSARMKRASAGLCLPNRLPMGFRQHIIAAMKATGKPI